MIDKIAHSVAEAIGPVADGATVLVGGFGTAGIPSELVDGLIDAVEGLSQTELERMLGLPLHVGGPETLSRAVTA